MKYTAEHSTRTIMVNGVAINVARNINYLTINMNNTVQAWEKKPYLWDGYWHSNNGDPLGVRIGHVELEDDESWTTAFGANYE